METPRGPELTRRRAFRGVGRYPETLQSVSAELNPEGTDYVMLDADSSPHPPLLTTLQALLRASSTPLSRQEILSRWPESEPPPRADSLWRCLNARLRNGPLHPQRRRHQDGGVSVRSSEESAYR